MVNRSSCVYQRSRESYREMAINFSLVLLVTLSLLPALHSALSVESLPSYDEIDNLTAFYQSSFNIRFSEDRFFPTVRFTHNGSIIGWRFPAAPNPGRGLPVLSVLRPITANSYQRVEWTSINTCTVSAYTLSNGTEVEVHESGPEEPIPFQEGDILGLLLRNNRAHFVPYLYNSTFGNREGNLSYYLPRQNIRDEVYAINDQVLTDTLLPLLALKTCVDVSTSNSTSHLPLCDGQTLYNNVTCLEVVTETTTLSTLSPDLLIVSITVPVLGSLLILVCLLALVLCLCVCSVRASKKRHSMYTDEAIPMDDIAVTVVVEEPTDMLDHTYDSVDALKDSVVRAVNNDVYDSRKADSMYHHGNGAVANYEEPVFSLSQYDASQDGVKHLYDRPRDVVAPHTPLPDPPPPFNRQPSPLSHSTKSPPTDHEFYHSLEQPGTDLGLSSLVIHTTRASHVTRASATPSPSSSPQPSPKGSLPREPSPQLGSKVSFSPKPRHRLKSAPNLGRKTHSGNHLRVDSEGVGAGELPRPHSEQGYSALRSHNFSFRLETGVYVPTNKQRNEFPSHLIFDDTIYASLSQAAYSPSVNNWSFFEESETYWRPSSHTSDLYEQLSGRKYREINRKQIQITSHLGSGEFGTVCKGLWRTEQGELEVAVKMLNSKATEQATVRFLQEAAIVGQFRHPNIVRLHGVVTVGEPVMIVLELVNNGDLRKYLKSLRPNNKNNNVQLADLPRLLLDFSSQIALGMEYLSRKEFVHRDLATRNILLTDDFICKIADFGLSRDLEDEEYYISNGGKIPIKWTAPEALHYRKYSSASDVWSFGALMYEAWSLGQTPYKNSTPEETVSLVDTGYRLPPPPGCPRAIYKLMIECWHPDAHQRPTFTELVQHLSQPEETLLVWSHDDNSVHPQASSLGALLSLGEQLYPDLQNMYTNM